MTDHEYAIYEALKGTHEFGGKYAAQFPDTSKAKPAFARLPLLIKEIGPVNTKPGGAPSPATAKKKSQIDEVRIDLLAIAETARTINDDEPGFSTAFKVGPDTQRANIDTANAFLKELAKPGVAEKFIAYDMPADFVADLQADLAAIGVTGDEQIEDKREDVGDTAEIRTLIQEGSDLLKILNTSVTNKFRDQPTILAEWQTASHIRRRRRKGDDKKEDKKDDDGADPAVPAK
jgi:hypothetical protein